MDRMLACEAGDPGSIPGGSTNKKTTNSGFFICAPAESRGYGFSQESKTCDSFCEQCETKTEQVYRSCNERFRRQISLTTDVFMYHSHNEKFLLVKFFPRSEISWQQISLTTDACMYHLCNEMSPTPPTPSS